MSHFGQLHNPPFNSDRTELLTRTTWPNCLTAVATGTAEEEEAEAAFAALISGRGAQEIAPGIFAASAGADIQPAFLSEVVSMGPATEVDKPAHFAKLVSVGSSAIDKRTDISHKTLLLDALADPSSLLTHDDHYEPTTADNTTWTVDGFEIELWNTAGLA